MSNQPNLEQGTLGLMEDLAEMLQAENFPTHPPLIQLIDKISEDPTLKQVDLSYKYTRLAAVVGADWITVKEELRSATRFGAPAFYCSISAMLAVLTCCRSRSHNELLSSLMELYNHNSAGKAALNKRIKNAITTMEHANVAEASIANLNERVDIALTTIFKQTEHANTADVSIASIVEQAENAVTTKDKQVEQVNKAEASLAKIIERSDHASTTMEKEVNKYKESIADVTERADQDYAPTRMDKLVDKAEASINFIIETAESAESAINIIANQIKQTNVSESIPPPTASKSPTEKVTQDNMDVIAMPGSAFRCEYGTVTIYNQFKFFSNGSLEAEKLAMWFTLPIPNDYQTRIMNADHKQLIKLTTAKNILLLNTVKRDYNYAQRKQFVDNLLANTVNYKAGQWSYIS